MIQDEASVVRVDRRSARVAGLILGVVGLVALEFAHDVVPLIELVAGLIAFAIGAVWWAHTPGTSPKWRAPVAVLSVTSVAPLLLGWGIAFATNRGLAELSNAVTKSILMSPVIADVGIGCVLVWKATVAPRSIMLAALGSISFSLNAVLIVYFGLTIRAP